MNLVVLGATSGIAQGVIREAARRGDALFLVARSAERLEALAADLRVRGAKVFTLMADLDDLARHAAIVAEAESSLGSIDAALVAHGTLTRQADVLADPRILDREIRTNFTSAASLLEHLGKRLEARRSGVLAVITSVAGDRGRQSNYAYGAAKAGLIAYVSGLRNRLHPSGVAMLDVRPGFVATPMTAHLKQGPLFASADSVGRSIYAAMAKRRDVVYTPFFWAWIMRIIKAVPEPVFKRLRL